MAEVNIDIAKETSVAAVKDDTTAIKSDVTTVKGDVAEVKTDTAAIKTDVTAVKSDVSTVKTNVANIKSKTDLIGSTSDTGGSATAGTVMGKLNALMVSSGSEKLIKPSATAARTITDGFGSGLSISKSQNAYKDIQASVKLMNCISFSKSGRVRIGLEYAADSIVTSNTNIKVGIYMPGNDISLVSFIDKAVGTSVSTDPTSYTGKEFSGRDSSSGAYPTTGTITIDISVTKGECYTPVFYYLIPKATSSYTLTVTNFILTAVKIYYEDADDVIYL